LLVLASAILLGGLLLFLDELLLASVISFRFVAAGGVLAFAGGYLLWTDFIAPRLGIKTWED
jgi:hypothetical protein